MDDEMQPSTSSQHYENNEASNLTNKYLCGELSFAEYTNEWYKCDEEEEDEKETNESTESASVTAKSSTRRRRTGIELCGALLGMIGQANISLAQGNKEKAEKFCSEVIKVFPTAAEPFEILARIYEDNPEKWLQYSLLSAHLGRDNAMKWLNIANISKERNDVKHEMICYTHAIRAEPHNLSLHMLRLERIDSLEKANYNLSSLKFTKLRCYRVMVNLLPLSEGETIMKYAKIGAEMYHKNNEIENAISIMQKAYNKCSSLFTLEDVNLFLELLIEGKQYQTCLDVFIAKVGIEIEAEIQTVQSSDGIVEEQTQYVDCSVPDDLPVDLRSKLMICFIHLGASNLFQSLLNDFLTNDVDKAGDLYMDIEEACSAVGHHELSLKLLEPLVKNTNFDLGAVWLKYADCLFALGRVNEAVDSYYKVISHAPQHVDARDKLSSILESTGNIDEALNVLEQNKKYVVSAQLLHKQCSLLKKYDRLLKYLEKGSDLLSKTFVRYRHMEELVIGRSRKMSIEYIHQFRIARGEQPFNSDDIHFDNEELFKLSLQEEWDLFKELLKIAKDNKKYYVMQHLSYGALMSKELVKCYYKEIDFYCLQACLLNGDYNNALRNIRELVLKGATVRIWNLLSFILNSVKENTHVKYLTRVYARETDVVKYLLMGNNCLTSGRYVDALKYYLDYHKLCREPISALLISITTLTMAAQRTVDKHHSLVLQGLAYLFTYKNTRKCDQEAYYNIGRAYQMLNIKNLAIEYYEKALACERITECPNHGVLDLTKEAAFNLYILYKDHAPYMARKYMFQYLVI